jgi:hypothetical protein
MSRVEPDDDGGQDNHRPVIARHVPHAQAAAAQRSTTPDQSTRLVPPDDYPLSKRLQHEGSISSSIP